MTMIEVDRKVDPTKEYALITKKQYWAILIFAASFGAALGFLWGWSLH